MEREGFVLVGARVYRVNAYWEDHRLEASVSLLEDDDVETDQCSLEELWHELPEEDYYQLQLGAEYEVCSLYGENFALAGLRMLELDLERTDLLTEELRPAANQYLRAWVEEAADAHEALATRMREWVRSVTPPPLVVFG